MSHQRRRKGVAIVSRIRLIEALTSSPQTRGIIHLSAIDQATLFTVREGGSRTWNRCTTTYYKQLSFFPREIDVCWQGGYFTFSRPIHLYKTEYSTEPSWASREEVPLHEYLNTTKFCCFISKKHLSRYMTINKLSSQVSTHGKVDRLHAQHYYMQWLLFLPKPNHSPHKL